MIYSVGSWRNLPCYFLNVTGLMMLFLGIQLLPNFGLATTNMMIRSSWLLNVEKNFYFQTMAGCYKFNQEYQRFEAWLVKLIPKVEPNVRMTHPGIFRLLKAGGGMFRDWNCPCYMHIKNSNPCIVSCMNVG